MQQKQKNNPAIVYEPRYVLISCIVILVVGAVTGGGVWWWMHGQTAMVESTLRAQVQNLEQAVSTLEAADEAAAPASERPAHEVDIMTAALGSQFGGLILTQMEPYHPDEPLRSENAIATFAGTLTLSGIMYYDDALDRVCMTGFDSATHAQLPYLAGDTRQVRICILNASDDLVATIVEVGDSIATMTIDTYQIARYPGVLVNYAQVVSVDGYESLMDSTGEDR